MDTGIVFSDNSDVVFNDTFAQVLPSLVGFRIWRLSWSRIKNIGAAKVRAEELSNFWPSHEFVDREELEQLGIEGDLGVANILVDSV